MRSLLVLLPFVSFPLAFADPCGPASPKARELVVSPKGPYRSIQEGLNAAGAGDIVRVRAGIYRGEVELPRSGEPGRCLYLLGEPGAVVEGGSFGIQAENKSHFVIRGLEVRNQRGGDIPTGIRVHGSGAHFEVRDNHVHHVVSGSNAHGMSFYGTGTAPLTDLLVDGNEIHDCKLGQSESMVFNGNVTKFVVSHNRVHDNDNIGIDFIGYEHQGPEGHDQARDGVCVENEVWNISSKNNATYTGEPCADGIYVDGGRDIVIERNRVRDTDIGIEAASEHRGKSTANITIRDNTVSGSYQGNIMMGGADADRNGQAVNIVVEGNHLSRGGTTGEITMQNNCSDITLRNNVMSPRSGVECIQTTGRNNSNVRSEGNRCGG